MLLAIRESAVDMSPFVRKTAAHAIPKLFSLLVDVEEWGQVVIVNMLTRYARTQFADPNLGEVEVDSEKEKEFYENSDEDEDEENTEKERKTGDEAASVYKMDPDHRLLLRSARPLLQSRNA